MSDNQYVFEIIRDIGYLIQNIKPHETVWFHVTNDDGEFFTARSSAGMPCGLSETSRAIELAYKVTRGCPDTRDTEIERLKCEIDFIKNYKQYESKAKKVRHHPKCNFLDVDFAVCDCGAYKEDK